MPTNQIRSKIRSAVVREIEDIRGQYEAATTASKAAASMGDRMAAEDARREAEGQFWAAGQQLADLFILMLRYALDHRPGEVGFYLAKLVDDRIDIQVPDLITAVMEERRNGTR